MEEKKTVEKSGLPIVINGVVQKENDKPSVGPWGGYYPGKGGSDNEGIGAKG